MLGFLKTSTLALVLGGALTLPLTATSAESESLKIGFIDPLSGPFGPVGDFAMKHFKFVAEEINAAGGSAGMSMEIIPFDNKVSPKESLVQLQKAIDQGIRIIAQGNGSSVAGALSKAISKHNRRNPGEEVIFLNYAAINPNLTNEDCSYWHFRFDSHIEMKMAGLTDWLIDAPDIKSVYVFGQDYSGGRIFSEIAIRMIGEKRPDIEIVGNEFHPIGRVKDFTPYVQKMMAADADAVITGNWGADIILLIKAAAASGQNVPYLTFYGGGPGAATGMGDAGVGLVKQISEYHRNADAAPEQHAKVDAFETAHGGLNYYFERISTMLGMLDAAVEKTGSDDVLSIAAALEGMTYETPYGMAEMRAEDHQLIQPLFVSTFSDDTPRKIEGTAYGFKTDVKIPAAATDIPSSCQMKRPG